MILTKFRGAETSSLREQNEFLMMLLRAHCEGKQVRHTHDTAENRSEFLNQYLGGSTIFMKAKRSLTSSFDQLLKRKGSRDDFGPIIKEMSLPSNAALCKVSVILVNIYYTINRNTWKGEYINVGKGWKLSKVTR